ncbi:uncharacterized protein [Gossypium hirsutum]|uniref:DNA/RNA polymerases superfamily protein n=1 Tax=Gossypium hirsutum TaxID=3635 RepID=A0A1U8IM36_GOSHI|nr:uncharacterized protein LOC107898211 [Gossypium hirsutum]
MLNLDTSEKLVSPATETGSHDRMALEDALSQAMLRILEKRERDFSALVEKAKIAEEVKRVERQNWDKERGNNKKDLEPSSSAMRPKRKVRSGGPVRVRAPIAPTRITLCGHCGRRHPGDCWRMTGACLRSGSTEHHVHECLLRADQVQAVDIGSTHSYVACSVSKNLGISVESTSSEVTMLSPLGQSVRVSKLYRDVPLEVQGIVFLTDLMKLLFREFDMILRMDWLVKHHNYLDNMISALVAKKLVHKGCEAYLAYVSVFASGDFTVKDIRTMKDFSNVFPKELPSLPLNQKVEFGIQLLLGTASVSIAPYRMASKELMELKAQIQELSDRGFIRPSVSL